MTMHYFCCILLFGDFSKTDSDYTTKVNCLPYLCVRLDQNSIIAKWLIHAVSSRTCKCFPFSQVNSTTTYSAQDYGVLRSISEELTRFHVYLLKSNCVVQIVFIFSLLCFFLYTTRLIFPPFKVKFGVTFIN